MEKEEKKLGFIFSEYPELLDKPKDFGLEQKIKDSFNKAFSSFSDDKLKRLWSYNRFCINIYRDDDTHLIYAETCFKLCIDNEAYHYYKKEKRALKEILEHVFSPFTTDLFFNEENNCFFCNISNLQENILKYGIESSPLKAISERRIIGGFAEREIVRKLKSSIIDGFKKMLQENLAFERMQTFVGSDNIKIGFYFGKEVEDVSICIYNDKDIYCSLPLIYRYLSKLEILDIFKDIFSPAYAKIIDSGFYDDMAIEIFNIKENLK